MSFITARAYNYKMPKYTFIQVHGVERAAKIRADRVSVENADGNSVIAVFLGDTKVGEFNKSSVQGWWIEDIPE